MQYVPMVRRRKLASELRRQRDLAGLTSGEAAAQVGWHQSKVSRIETGVSSVRPDDVTALLDAYGVQDQQLRSVLAALAGEGAQRGWWHEYRDVLPSSYRDFISLETDAGAARTLETTVVPGLLQTSDYARELTRSVLPELGDDEVQALVDVRLARQAVLRADPPLELWAVLDEAVVRRRVGGPEVMAAQLRQLVELGSLPHVRLQVLPFSAGGHIGVTGSFVIFSFPLIADLDVVVLDQLTSSLYLDRKEDIKAYGSAFDRLRTNALPVDDSLTLISEIAEKQATGIGA